MDILDGRPLSLQGKKKMHKASQAPYQKTAIWKRKSGNSAGKRGVSVFSLCMGRRSGKPYLKVVKTIPEPGSYKLSSPKRIYQFSMKYLFCDNPAEEYVYMIGVDNSCSPIGISEISHGTVKASFARPREIFERGLLMGAGGIIVIQNHVTGEVTPSAQDYIQSLHLQAASAIIGLPLIDHIIAGRKGYASVLSLLESPGAASVENITGDICDYMQLCFSRASFPVYEPETGRLRMRLPGSEVDITVSKNTYDQ